MMEFQSILVLVIFTFILGFIAAIATKKEMDKESSNENWQNDVIIRLEMIDEKLQRIANK